MRTSFDSIPGVSSKARAALMGAGFRDLESLADQDYASIGSISGIGQRTLERLQSALVKEGKSLGGDVPEAEKRSATWTKLEPAPELPGGRAEAINLINSLDSPKRKDHGILLLNIFFRATGYEPEVWGSQTIGFGKVHYRYATGREGDTFRVGFSPRKAKISLYGLTNTAQSRALLNELGKYSMGVSCLYINKPEDVDLAVLEEIIRISWSTEPDEC